MDAAPVSLAYILNEAVNVAAKMNHHTWPSHTLPCDTMPPTFDSSLPKRPNAIVSLLWLYYHRDMQTHQKENKTTRGLRCSRLDVKSVKENQHSVSTQQGLDTSGFIPFLIIWYTNAKEAANFNVDYSTDLVGITSTLVEWLCCF